MKDDESHITASQWSLPLRRRADQLFREGRLDEAARLLSSICRVLREEPQGGPHVTGSDLREPPGPAAVRTSGFVRA